MAGLLSGTEELMGYLSSEDTQPKTRRNKQACLTGASLAIMINKHIICKSNDHLMKCSKLYPSGASVAYLRLYCAGERAHSPLIERI